MVSAVLNHLSGFECLWMMLMMTKRIRIKEIYTSKKKKEAKKVRMRVWWKFDEKLNAQHNDRNMELRFKT